MFSIFFFTSVLLNYASAGISGNREQISYVDQINGAKERATETKTYIHEKIVFRDPDETTDTWKIEVIQSTPAVHPKNEISNPEPTDFEISSRAIVKAPEIKSRCPKDAQDIGNGKCRKIYN